MPERGSQQDSVATVIEKFIAELQRRKVVRVAIVYGAFAWLVLQFSDIIIEAFAAPDWVMRVLLLFLVIALPATLILAWLFDITPSGIHLTAENTYQNDEMQETILLITAPHHVDDAETLCDKLSNKLSPLIKRYGGKFAGIHEGHCIIQFRDTSPAVGCGLAILQLLRNSMHSAAISIAVGHYRPSSQNNSGVLTSQALGIAECINHPLTNNQQELMISTAVYERELIVDPNPLLEYCKAETFTINGHKLIAFRVDADVLTNPAIRWRLQDQKEEPSENQTVLTRHRVLLVSMLALVAAFSWLYLSQTDGGHEKPRSLAIMPFRSLDESIESKAISLGLNEELHDRVRTLEGIQVASSTSSRALAEKELDVPTIGERLNVDYLIEGSTRQQGSEYRISINLSEATSGKLIWSHIYQTNLDELYSVQENILHQLATQLKVKNIIGFEHIQLSNKDYGTYLKAIGYFELPNAIDHVDKVETTLEELLTRYPDYAPVEAGLCRVHLTRFNFSKAISDYHSAASYCEAAENSISNNLDILSSLAQMNIVQGNWEKASAYIEKGLSIEPENLYLLLQSADIHNNTDNLEIAEEILLKVIRLEPGSWKSHDRLGMIYLGSLRLHESIDEFKKAAELMPTEVKIYNHLGAAYFQLGDFDLAAQAFVQSLAMKPNFSAYSSAGTLYYFSGDFNKAREFNLKATQLEPKLYLLWRNLADTESAIPGLYESAMTHYQLASTMAKELLQVTPKDTQALSNLAWALAQTDKPDEAEEHIQSALRLAPENRDVLYDASITYTRLGNEPKALEYVRRAIDAGMPAAVIAATPGLNAFYPGSDI